MLNKALVAMAVLSWVTSAAIDWRLRYWTRRLEASEATLRHSDGGDRG